MDDGSGFTFPPVSDFRGQESSDVSWGDIFLDGLNSDDQNALERLASEPDLPSDAVGLPGVGQQLIQTPQQPPQQHQGIMGGQVHIQMQQQMANQHAVSNARIPTHLQGSLPNNGLQQNNTMAYLAPSATSSQIVSTASSFQNVMTAGGQPLATTSVAQQQQQANAKLVQLTPNFPVASVQQLTNGVPLQTFLSSNQTLAGQTIYRSQSGLFPTQGSVHIENPKVVNVNFGPHVIGSDGSSQQAYIQTAEGKPVFITNPQIQQMPQSLNLAQPLVGTQLLNQTGGNVLRTSIAQGAQQSVGNQARQIVLPSGQTVIPRQPDPAAKNVVLRQLNPNPVIYPAGQAGQLQIQPQSALITSSGQGLQVVNAGGSQGNQVQLIAQGQQQQLNQNTIMNLLNGQGVLNNGLVPSGQNILVNGQVVNLGQLGGLTMQQLQLPQQTNSIGGNVGVTLAQAAVASRPVAGQLQQQPTTQQHQLLLQQNNGSGNISVLGSNRAGQMQPQIMLQQQQKVAVGLPGVQQGGLKTGIGSNAGSNCSTPVPTPTPSTPTPTPTPDPLLDSDSAGGGKGAINILEQALSMSQIDLQSFEDDFNFYVGECMPSASQTPVLPPTPAPPATPTPPPKQKTKRQSKKSKAAAASQPPIAVQQPQQQVPAAQIQNAKGQKVTVMPQQKIIAMNGQVYVLSANGQQLILQQPSTTTVTSIAPQLKPIPSQAAPTVASTVPSQLNRNIPSSATVQQTPQSNIRNTTIPPKQQKLSLTTAGATLQQQKNIFITATTQSDNKVYVKASSDPLSTFKVQSTLSGPEMSRTLQGNASLQSMPKSSASFSLPNIASGSTVTVQGNQIQVKAQKITTLEGSFVKQEPLTAVVKQEPGTNPQVTTFPPTPQPSVSTFPSIKSGIQDPSQLATSTTGSNSVPLSAALVVSTAAFTTVTTQIHQSTIMISSPSVGTTAGASTATTSSISGTGSKSSSSSKEKDPSTIKSMTPIRIGDSTLMLSLTPPQKERLEDHLSKMSMEEQKVFLDHQQNLNMRIQQVQKEQQQKLLQQQQKQQQQQRQHLAQQELSKQVHPSQQALPPLSASSSAVLRLPDQPKPNSSQQPQQQKQMQPLPPLQLKNNSNVPTPAAHHACEPASGNLAPASGVPTTVEELEENRQEGKKSLQTPATSQSYSEKLSQQKRAVPLGQQQQQQKSQTPQAHQAQPTLPQSQQPAQPAQATPSSTKQNQYPQLGRCLAEQQLLRDCTLALKPDVHKPFKDASDARRRLVRYHTLQDHKPEEDSKTVRTWEAKYSKLCDFLMKKKRYYMRRFNKLRLYHDMCNERHPESIQNLLCFNEQLQVAFDAEKEEAKNHPETFQPVRPVQRGPSPEEQRLPSPRHERHESSKSHRSEKAHKKSGKKYHNSSGSPYFKEPFIKEEMTESRTRHEIWESPRPSYSMKRKASPDRPSSGTLKLVFKRRTTDDFSVKNSCDVPMDVKPVLNLEKSDSECEFESVGRRTSSQSIASQQASLAGASENSDRYSESSESGEEEEEEEDDSQSESEKDSDGEEDVVETNGGGGTLLSTPGHDCESVIKFKKKKRRLKAGQHVSFENVVENQSVNVGDDDEGDAFMETENHNVILQSEGKSVLSGRERKSNLSNVFKFSDISSAGTESSGSGKKSARNLSHTASITSNASDDVFSSALLPESEVSPDLGDNNSAVCSVQGSETSTATITPASHNRSFQPLHSPPQLGRSAELSAAITATSSISTVEKEAACKGLPASSIFTTPNKSLLQTDAMFNSSSDEEEDFGNASSSSQARLVSRFKIDNKDPQSSMINASVRSAINSVLNNDDDEDANGLEDEDSQASWSSAQHPPSSASSSVPHPGLFHLPSSPSLHPGHDTDLDAAVQSILNG